MIGVNLEQHGIRFGYVPDDMDENAVGSIPISEKKKSLITRYYNMYYGEGDFEKIARNLNYNILIKLGKEAIAKISHSTIMMMDHSVEDQFRKDPELRLYHKIRNSIWQWGGNRCGWNELASNYNSVLSFDFGVPGFTTALDYTTGYNEKGYSEYSRIYLDGIFGYNVHYKDEHVMTIGFTIMKDKTLLIQQVQNVKAKGNRWRYKLPENILEYVIDRFRIAFPEHEIYIADGRSYVNSSIRSYQSGLKSADESKRPLFIEKLKHLRLRKNDIIRFYQNTGKYSQQDKKVVRHFLHYKLVLTS